MPPPRSGIAYGPERRETSSNAFPRFGLGPHRLQEWKPVLEIKIQAPYAIDAMSTTNSLVDFLTGGNSDASASAGSIASKFRSGRAPARSSARTVCSSPKAVATTSAVRPVPVRASLDAPRAKSNRTTSAAPWRAATCADVRRRAGVASTARKGLIYARAAT